MTKKDYIKLAKAIKENRESPDRIYAERFINALCDILVADNQEFDKAKFLEACNGRS